jgi:hypothetical protein
VAAVVVPMGSVLVRAAALAWPLAMDVRRTNLVVMTVPPVGNEADLAMKEEQVMSERLRGTRGVSLTIIVVLRNNSAATVTPPALPADIRGANHQG